LQKESEDIAKGTEVMIEDLRMNEKLIAGLVGGI
jgi:hypothetical protein